MEKSLHIIQKDILTSLLQSKRGKRYAKMRPEKIDNDLYNYHLQELVKKGYITKQDNLYDLTRKGKLYISKLSATGESKTFFKISTVSLVFRKNFSEVLLQERKRKPFYGDITSIAGKVLRGEKIEEAAKRKFKEETGLEARFKFVGVLRKIKRNKEKEILEDTFYHYCVAKDPVGELEKINIYGRHFWAPSQDLVKYSKKNIDSGDLDVQVQQRLVNKDFSYFYLEQDSIVKSY